MALRPIPENPYRSIYYPARHTLESYVSIYMISSRTILLRFAAFFSALSSGATARGVLGDFLSAFNAKPFQLGREP